MRAKKILAVVLSTAMLLGIGSQVMAKTSITATLDTNNVQASAGSVTISKEVDTANLAEEGKKGVQALQSVTAGASLSEAFRSAGLDLAAIAVQSGKTADGKEIKTEDLKVLSPVVDLIIDGAEPTKENPVDVTFTVNNATDDISVYVLHFCEEHKWELLETTKDAKAANQVQAAFHSASPVALVYVDKADAANGTKAPATK